MELSAVDQLVCYLTTTRPVGSVNGHSQRSWLRAARCIARLHLAVARLEHGEQAEGHESDSPVSYTHLTLPTIYSV